jgi:hypothetical protein
MADDAQNASTTDTQALPGPMSRRGKRPNLFVLRFPRLVRTLRVITFGACVLLALGAFQLHRVHGQMGERLVDTGQLLMGYANAEHQDGTRAVVVNGETIHFSSGVTHDSAHDLLEHFTAVCDAHDGGTVERFTTLPAMFGHHSGAMLDPVFRYETETGGVVACLDLGADELSLEQLNERMQRFRTSHDVHDVGDIRYVFAEPTSDAGITHFVTFWTDGSFRLDRAMPAEGHDAAGTDLENVPRPPGAFRTMSAAEVGNADSAVQYMGSSMTGWQLEGYYQHALVESGWTLIPIREDARPRETYVVQAARDDGSQVVFVALGTQRDGRGIATIALSR